MFSLSEFFRLLHGIKKTPKKPKNHTKRPSEKPNTKQNKTKQNQI